MMPRVLVGRALVVACATLSLYACSSGGATVSPMRSGDVAAPLSGGRAPGGGAGSPATDGPAWTVTNGSAAVPDGTANVDFAHLQNNVQGGQAIGSARTAQIVIINTSKKTPLTISQVDLEGADASDFTISAASLGATDGKTFPANKNTGAVLQIAFAPSQAGTRNASLRIVSNAGTSLSTLTGTGLSPQPVIDTAASLAFAAGGAPATLAITNDGSAPLILKSATFGGANPGAFVSTAANHGISNCYAGIQLAAHATCYTGLGPAAGASAPQSAVFEIFSNDPATPEKDVRLAIVAP